jgi:DNA-binding transcriptional regulator YdaS (Cro superfamily)
MKISEQIKALEATRAAKAARMEEIATKSMTDGTSMTTEDQEEFDNIDAEVKALDADLVRFHRLEGLSVQKGRRVEATDGASEQRATGARGPTIIVADKNKDDVFKGQSFTRVVIAKALASLEGVAPSRIAQARWGKTNPALVEFIKANEVAGGGEASGEWGAELVSMDGRFTGDFIEWLNGLTVYDRLALRAVPANVTIKGQDGAATGYWVGEGKAIPATKADFSTVNLTPLKVAALAVISNELIRDSSPSAESLVRDALGQAAAQRIDGTFISASAASGGVSPAGILNGLVGIASTGNDADAVREGILALYGPFLTAKNASGLTLVMNPARAKAISLMRNALGQREFPDLNANGGTLEGDPVVTGDNVNEAHVLLLKPSDIYKIGDGGVQVSISRDATIEMATDGTGDVLAPTGQSKQPVSMFQSESTAIKIVRAMNFAKRRASAVAYVDDASWGDAAS